MNIHDLLPVALSIAKEAASLIMAIYSSRDFNVKLKSDRSPLTEADTASHNYISQELKNRTGFPVLSEEDPIDYSERKDWRLFWLVDPLDGTKDFIARNDEFTINIALIEKNTPVIGIVGVPAQKIVYYGSKGRGAFKLYNGQEQRISNDRHGLSQICAESRFHSSEKTKAFCQKYGIKKVVTFGAALKLCKMAEGEVDVYPRFNPTKEWDTAAAHCILNEAQCRLIDMASGRDLTYNREDLVNPGFLACRRNLNFEIPIL